MRKCIYRLTNSYTSDYFLSSTSYSSGNRYHYRFVFSWTKAKQFFKAYKSYLVINSANFYTNDQIRILWATVDSALDITTVTIRDISVENLIDHTKIILATLNKYSFDITKAVSNALKDDKNLVFDITFSNGRDGFLSTDFFVETYYSSIFENAEQRSFEALNLANGSVGIDFYNGAVVADITDVKTNGDNPIVLRHIFNSAANGNQGYSVYTDDGQSAVIFDTKCGEGWKLNYQQCIVSEKGSAIFDDKETSVRYTWIRGDGSQINFDEKYYYENNSVKTYCHINDVTLDDDLELQTNSGSETKAVLREISESKGYTISVPLRFINGSDYVMRDGDQLSQIEGTIRQLELNIEGLKEQIEAINNQPISGTNEPNQSNGEQETFDESVKESESERIQAIIKQYTGQLNLYKKQADELKKVTPYIVITDKSGNEYGFGYTDYYSGNGEISLFKLIYISDAFGNKKILSYNEDGDLISISSGADVVYLSYKNNRLSEVLQETRTSFEYKQVNGVYKLTEADNISPRASKAFTVSYGDTGNLTEITGIDGQGYCFGYSQGKCNQVRLIYGNNNAEYVLPDSFSDKKLEIIYNNDTIKDFYNVRTESEFDGNICMITYDDFGNIISRASGGKDLEGGGTYNNAKYNYFESYKKTCPNAFRYSVQRSLNCEDAINSNEVLVTSSHTDGNYYTRTLTLAELTVLRSMGTKKLVFSCYATANSLYQNSELRIGGRNHSDKYENTPEVDPLLTELDEYRANRRFSVEIVFDYTSVTKFFRGCFDYRTVNEQFFSLPIFLDDLTTESVNEVTIKFCFDNNYGNATFKDLSLRSADWQYTGLNEKNDPVRCFDTENVDSIIQYGYDNNDKISIITKRNEVSTIIEVISFYYGVKGELRKIISTKGDVTEYYYDEFGNVIKTVEYNVNEPQYKYVSQNEYVRGQKKSILIDELGSKFGTVENLDVGETLTEQEDGASFVANDDITGDSIAICASADQLRISNTIGYTLDYRVPKTLKCASETIEYTYDSANRLKTVKINGKTYCEYTYNDDSDCVYRKYNGNRIFKEKRSQYGMRTEHYYYVGEENEQSQQSVYTVDRDKNGKPTYIEDRVIGFNRIYNYDKFDRLTGRAYGVYIFYIECLFDYDSLGRVTERTDKVYNQIIDKATINYKSNFENEITDISHTAVGLEELSYDALKRVTKYKLNAPQLIKAYTYVQNGEKTSNRIKTETTVLKDYIDNTTVYKYNKDGNISEIYVNNVLNKRYSYDGFKRLIREDDREMNYTKTYYYDENGNIIERREYPFTKGHLEDSGYICAWYLYKYSEGNRLYGYNGQSCVYDDMGYPTQYRNKSATWSMVNRLASLGSATFTYDFEGTRLTKTADGVSHTYFTDEGRLIEEHFAGENENENVIQYFYGAQGILGMSYNGYNYYYVKNIFGDVLALLDEYGAVVARYIYDAWGNHKVLNMYGSEDLLPFSIGNINPIRYRGYYYDRETGLYYLKTRYYDPQTGRFISPDGIKYLDPSSVSGLNLYAYCGNNPVMNVDPTGTFFEWIVLGIIAVVAIVATVNDIIQIVNSTESGVLTTVENNNVHINNSHKILTPWVQFGYSFYLNHIKDDTKDIIKGSSVGVQFEWELHNIAYYGLDVVDTIIDSFDIHVSELDKYKNQATSVDIGPTIYHDNHSFSVFMFIVYNFTYPLSGLYDLLTYLNR